MVVVRSNRGEAADQDIGKVVVLDKAVVVGTPLGEAVVLGTLLVEPVALGIPHNNNPAEDNLRELLELLQSLQEGSNFHNCMGCIQVQAWAGRVL